MSATKTRAQRIAAAKLQWERVSPEARKHLIEYLLAEAKEQEEMPEGEWLPEWGRANRAAVAIIKAVMTKIQKRGSHVR